jgi:four helix bundle protein
MNPDSHSQPVTRETLKQRTKVFALRVMKLVAALPDTAAGRVIGNQLLRCGTSVGANYRAACRGRSGAEFVAKSGVMIEEADECGFWMELIMEGNCLPQAKVDSLHTEASELVAIFNGAVRTTRSRK